MQMTSLGRSGPTTSRIGLGLAALGRPGYINIGHADDLGSGRDVAVMEARAHAVLDAGWNAGVRYFDAARSYGRAEEFLTSWIASRGIAPGAVTIGSKWGYVYTAGWAVDAEKHEVKDHSLANLERQAAETRKTLGSHVSLYQIHSATLESGVLEDRSVLERLGRLRDAEGWRIGLSLTGPRQAETLDRAMEVEVDGLPLFDCVQATWNLLETSAGEALARAHAAGLGVILKETMANGRLAGRNDEPGFAEARARIGAEASRLGTTADALAMAAALARPWADVVLSGASGSDQLASNLKAAGVAWDRQAEETLARLAEPAGDYWLTRSRLAWN